MSQEGELCSVPMTATLVCAEEPVPKRGQPGDAGPSAAATQELPLTTSREWQLGRQPGCHSMAPGQRLAPRCSLAGTGLRSS